MLYFFDENINRASVERYCWHVNAPSDASSRRSRSFFINRKSATILHIFKRALALQHGGNMRRNQIGSACAGSNPAVRALNKSGRARVVKGFDSNIFFSRINTSYICYMPYGHICHMAIWPMHHIIFSPSSYITLVCLLNLI